MRERKQRTFEIPDNGINNLLSIYDKRLPCDEENGLNFYYNQHKVLQCLAKDFNVCPERVAAMMAVLSPGARWEDIETSMRKILMAKSRYEVGFVRVYPNNVDKAWRILRGDAIVECLKGPKVNAFMNNLLRPNDDSFVTVDGHIYCAWLGRRMPLKEVPDLSGDRYEKIVTDVRTAAKTVLESPQIFQALVWWIWRELYVRKNRQLSLFLR